MAASTSRTVLTFRIGLGVYALPIGDVLEVVRAAALSAPPGGDSLLEGMINLRGRTAPVFDVRATLRLEPKPVEPSDYLIIFEWNDRPAAIRVDGDVDMKTVDDDRFEPSGNLPGGDALVVEIARMDEQIVRVLDTRRLASTSTERTPA